MSWLNPETPTGFDATAGATTSVRFHVETNIYMTGVVFYRPGNAPLPEKFVLASETANESRWEWTQGDLSQW